MRVHHLNCGCLCPFGGRLMDGSSRGLAAHLVCHCLLIESESGLVLCDTGCGMRDVRDPRSRLSRALMAVTRPVFDERLTAIRQIEALGFTARDVRHIVLTHLDFDHAGGLEDFPQARVHVLETEREAALARTGPRDKRRYRLAQWDDVTHWRTYRPGGEAWFGFDAVHDLDGLPPEILLVPLAGHTLGHSGIAVHTPSGWLLHAGDAYFHHAEVGASRRSCPVGLRMFQSVLDEDRTARLRNQDRLRTLSTDPEAGVRMFCSHDRTELEAYLEAAPGRAPATAA